MIKLNPYPILAAIIALGALYGAHRGIVAHEVSVAITNTSNKLENEYKGMLLQSASDARKQTQKLELHALALEKAKDEKIDALSGKLNVALKRLQDRPSRPSPTNPPNPVQDTRACAGSELYREDSEFLIREAARAEALIIERDYYYHQYEDARKTLDEYAASH